MQPLQLTPPIHPHFNLSSLSLGLLSHNCSSKHSLPQPTGQFKEWGAFRESTLKVKSPCGVNTCPEEHMDLKGENATHQAVNDVTPKQ